MLPNVALLLSANLTPGQLLFDLLLQARVHFIGIAFVNAAFNRRDGPVVWEGDWAETHYPMSSL